MPFIPSAALLQSGTMVLLGDSLLAVDAASFDFAGLPQNYRHLQVMGVVRGTQAAVTVAARMTFNNDSGAKYSYRWIYAGVTVQTFSESSQASFYLADTPGASAAAGLAGIIRLTVPNYAQTAFQKNIEFTGNYESQSLFQVARYADTSAVNRITIFPSSGNWLAGSQISVYGIL